MRGRRDWRVGTKVDGGEIRTNVCTVPVCELPEYTCFWLVCLAVVCLC